jgi:hypothetical protein
MGHGRLDAAARHAIGVILTQSAEDDSKNVTFRSSRVWRLSPHVHDHYRVHARRLRRLLRLPTCLEGLHACPCGHGGMLRLLSADEMVMRLAQPAALESARERDARAGRAADGGVRMIGPPQVLAEARSCAELVDAAVAGRDRVRVGQGRWARRVEQETA